MLKKSNFLRSPQKIWCEAHFYCKKGPILYIGDFSLKILHNCLLIIEI
ncbi:hypothetical protein CNEO4_1270004 [Clostridium neonatale]|uniref:Uncharacterized protein n=1 Tax=Clostridium neonatale TaxID=137838 RepID=A0AA86JCC8_9CLOT|nr:hypothetical protein CNEO_10164 [Clostridium neonatale]CAI3551053.1 hypothetical protein CNEO3_2190001 [Clostridium neonatale]CAI3573349.1 hypothetical protein CNEO3_1520003 [Clostridium neonatale]CAI3576817.1 hypothetical protein CNEO3_1690002 [Clostridium neonatale]CAI3580570.1 hypothetical protein CNEO3_1620002 [Clostridium neonatale]